MSVVDDDQLRVHPKVLLFVHFHAEAFQCPQRREGVENIPLTDAALSTAENVHFDTAISCRREPFENDRIDVFGMLDIQPFGRRVDELRHAITRIGITPQQAFIVAAVPIAMLPVGVEYFDDLRDVVGVVGDDAVVTGKREVLSMRLKVATSVAVSSTTIDFSCVT